MINFLKRFLCWQCRFLFSMYEPGLLTLVFAMAAQYFFPGSPIWPVGVFAILVIVMVGRYVKW